MQIYLVQDLGEYKGEGSTVHYVLSSSVAALEAATMMTGEFFFDKEEREMIFTTLENGHHYVVDEKVIICPREINDYKPGCYDYEEISYK